MSLVLIRKTAPTGAWLAALREACSDIDVHVWPETGPVEDVEFVLTWGASPGVIASFPNLRAIFSLGAGVDHILLDETVPPHLPIARMVDSGLTAGMVRHVTLAVLQHQRRWETLRAQQAARQWSWPELGSLRVGVMGLGELGAACATALAGLGFEVAGWSRTGRQVAQVQSFSTMAQLGEFLGRSDVLVNLLPLTDELEGILDHRTFARLPRGACLVNVGRGEHLVESDLIAALDQGQLSQAVLDVFRVEPLPADHVFWSRPDILITPHNASVTQPATAVAHVAANIVAARQGRPLRGQVDRQRGY